MVNNKRGPGAGRPPKHRKNPLLISARNVLGLSVAEVSAQAGFSITSYNKYENDGEPVPIEAQTKICQFYRDRGVFLFEEDVFPRMHLNGMQRKRFLRDRSVPEYACVSLGRVSESALSEKDFREEIFQADEAALLRELMKGIPERYASFVVDYYGLNGEGRMTYEEVGRKYGVSRARAGVKVKEGMKRLAVRYKMTMLNDLLAVMPEFRDVSGRRFIQDLIAARRSGLHESQ